MSHALVRAGKALRWLLRCFVGLTLLAIVLFVCIQVFSRYFIGAATPELAEMSRLLFIWLTFAGSALLISRGELITIDFVSNSLKQGRTRLLLLLTDLCTAVFLIALMIYALELMRVVGGKIAPATGLPYVSFYGSLVVFAGLGLFFIVERLVSSRLFTLDPRGKLPHSSEEIR